MPIDQELPPAVEQTAQPGQTVGPNQYSGTDEPGPDHNLHADLLAEPTPAPSGEQEFAAPSPEPVTHIPVVEHPGEQPSGLIENPEKAHVMALAEDPARELALGSAELAAQDREAATEATGDEQKARNELADGAERYVKTFNKLAEANGVAAGTRFDAENGQAEDDRSATQPLPPPGIDGRSPETEMPKALSPEAEAKFTEATELASKLSQAIEELRGLVGNQSGKSNTPENDQAA